MPRAMPSPSPSVAKPRSPAVAKRRPRVSTGRQRLSPAEREIIAYFAPWGEVLGVPPSVAQIYGLLFASGAPLDSEEIRARLAASKGSVSQGLRFLRERKLVVPVAAGAARRERFEAVASPGLFVQTQLRDEVLPRLDAGAARLDSLKAAVAGDAELAARVARLDGWNRRGRELLPMLLNLLGG